ncbi:MAG TPA: hypothetical protein VK507_19885 [Iamia sp.]|nr:hypothetical protein [Iamia sp.]
MGDAEATDPPRRTEPGLGPYRGPVVVLALIAGIVLGGLLLALVGAVRAPDDVSNSATVLGTFPLDPGAEGIPAARPAPGDPGASTVPPEIGSTPPTTATTTPVDPGSEADIADAFDGDLAAWEPVDGEWAVEDGALVVPEATDDAPVFLLRTAEASGIGAEVGVSARAAGLVVGYTDPGTYVAALAVPALGGWRLEVHVAGDEVANASVPAATGPGTVVELVVRDGEVALVVDGVEAGTVDTPDALGSRAGFVARGPAGGQWASALEGRTG